MKTLCTLALSALAITAAAPALSAEPAYDSLKASFQRLLAHASPHSSAQYPATPYPASRSAPASLAGSGAAVAATTPGGDPLRQSLVEVLWATERSYHAPLLAGWTPPQASGR